MKFETLPPEIAANATIIQKIDETLQKLQEIQTEKLQSIKNAPAGRLRVAKSHNSIQFFQVKPNEKPNGTYITKKNFPMAQQLAQKEYDTLSEQAITMQITFLKKIKMQLERKTVLNIEEKLHFKKIPLITMPLTLSDTEYAKRWQEVAYNTKGFTSETPEYFTAKGERVRSKSEIIIADTLNRLKIPYRYEYPVTVKSNDGKKITVHPDFCCLNVKTRKEYFWEHFGMMDNAEYSAGVVDKLHLYQKNDILPGKNLVFTIETSHSPLNTKHIEKIIREYLIN